MLGANVGIGNPATVKRVGTDRTRWFLARMEEQEPDPVKAIIATMIEDIDAAIPTFWDRIDGLYLPTLSTEQAGQLNLAGANHATTVGAPTHTPLQGVSGNGVAGNYWDLGLNPGLVSMHFKQNDASQFLWSRTNLNLTGPLDSSDFGVGNGQIRRNAATSGRATGRANTSTTVAFNTGAGAYPGFVGWTRSAADLWEGYAQGVDSGGATTASVALPSATGKLGATSSTVPGINQIAIALFGANFLAAEVAAQFTIFNDFITALDAL